MAVPEYVAIRRPREDIGALPARAPGEQGVWRRLAVASAASYALLTAAVTILALRMDDGHLVYTLDDPYIHLAMARNWLRSGILGISPGVFAPATSSPLWTALVTAFAYPLGVREWLPFALNVLACSLLLPLFWWGSVGIHEAEASCCPRRVAWWWYVAAILLPIVAHLPGLTLSGLEHPLHAALTIAFTVAIFEAARRGTRRGLAVLYLLALLVPLARLEGAFAVGAGAALLALHRKPVPAFLVAVAGAIPTLALGLYFRAHGAFVLPNSIVAKAVPATDLHGWFLHLKGQFLGNLGADPSLRAVVVVALIWLYYGWRARRRDAVEEAAYFLALAALHLLFASVGWFDRYQAYLIALGMFFFVRHTWPRTVVNPIAMLRRESALGVGLVYFLVIGFGVNKVMDYLAVPVATNNIYEQPYQTGEFIAEYYPRSAIVASDIGVVSLRAGGSVTDLAGLGSTDVLRALRAAGGHRGLRPGQIEPIVEKNGADLLVISLDAYDPSLYARWYPVATWTIGKRNVTLHTRASRSSPTRRGTSRRCASTSAPSNHTCRPT